MPRHTLTLTLVAAFAVSALAAPAALARPTDSISPQARNAAATQLHAKRQFTPGYTPGEHRGHEAYSSQSDARSAPYVTPSASQSPARTVSTGDGAPWTLIALGLGGAFLLIAMLAVARRARLRTHIAT
jgi:hypothetical protein